MAKKKAKNAKLAGKPTKKATAVRHRFTRYAGAEISRLTSDWITGATSANADIRRDLPLLRQRSRDLFGNNEYAKRFSSLVDQNIVGPNGITYQATVKNARGEQDDAANMELERAFFEWSAFGGCDVTGGMSFTDFCSLVITTVPSDGECFVRKIRGYPNKYGFALQAVDSDRLDEYYQQALPDGEINMSVEIDTWERPRAYHVLSRHPGDYVLNYKKSERVRIPSDEMIHLFRRERVGQIRGIPWMHASMSGLRQVSGYKEAEIISARLAASKMGFYKKTDGSQSTLGEGEDANGRLIKNAEPATFEELPYGYEFQEWNPQHPAGNYGPFMKESLRGVCSGFNVSYPSLANDLEGVNYSSIRAGLLDDRDSWSKLQQWFIGSFVQPVYSVWLEQAYLSGQVRITADQYLRAFTPKWEPRGWDWVDPLKDAQAASEALKNFLTTRTKLLAEKGMNFEDVIKQRAKEREIAEAYGFELNVEPTPIVRQKDDDEEKLSELRLVHG